jgi:hypothetical protein
MHCFKLLGQRVAARTFDRQITEVKSIRHPRPTWRRWP